MARIDWRKNVDNLLTFQEKDILQGPGSITNYEAEETAKQVYDVFNSKRKQVEAQNADADDLKMLEDLEQSLKNRRYRWQSNATPFIQPLHFVIVVFLKDCQRSIHRWR